MATVTATTARTHRSFNASQPPTAALPALPVPHQLNTKSSVQNLRKASLLPTTPKRTSSSSLGRTPSNSQRGPAAPLADSPTLPPTDSRRSISISSFPQPPLNGSRTTSIPPSPLRTQGSDERAASPSASPVRGDSKITMLKRPRPTASQTNMAARYSRDRDSGVAFLSSRSSSDHLSPPQSRTSSAQDSYSTVATTVDLGPSSGDETRGRTDERSGEKESKGNVVISVRVRPDGPEEAMNPEWSVDGKNGRVGYRGKDGGLFDYDNVFTPIDNNARVYDSCAKRLVRRVMEGYHGTVFAYGMTGTGKTYSMQGATSSPGVIPLAITDIFSYIRETPHREFLLRVSYLEIYNERIHDLLATQPGSTGFVPLDQQTKGEEIKIREDPKRGVYATPLKEEIVQSPNQLLKVIARGDLCRKTGSTQFNARSSRSHAVVQIVVESRDRIVGAAAGGASMADGRRAGISGGVRVSTLSLIDLAGSERAAEDKERRAEGAHINRSLLTLGTVIARLSKDSEKDKDGSHLPYRDSKLTRLLQPALSGNSLISILCTIAIPQGNAAASAVNTGETMNTLKFAARAKNNIVSHAKRSEESFGGSGVDPNSRALLERYRAEIGELRRELDQQKKKEEGESRERESRERELEEERSNERHGEQLLEIQLARTALKERIEHLNRLILCSKSSGVNSARSSLQINSSHLSMVSVRSSTSLATPITQTQSQRLSSSSAQTLSSTDDPEFPTDDAPLQAQFRALQADLQDKNRYIATLEKRLLQARRSSQSRMSAGLSGSPHRLGEGGIGIVPEGRVEILLKEKDEEIRELRERLDDKERMVAALRSAARKRDAAFAAVVEDGRRRSSDSSGGSSSGQRQTEGGEADGGTL